MLKRETRKWVPKFTAMTKHKAMRWRNSNRNKHYQKLLINWYKIIKVEELGSFTWLIAIIQLNNSPHKRLIASSNNIYDFHKSFQYRFLLCVGIWINWLCACHASPLNINWFSDFTLCQTFFLAAKFNFVQHLLLHQNTHTVKFIRNQLLSHHFQ